MKPECGWSFYWEFRKKWCLLKKYIAINPENCWVKKCCFKLILIRFHFVSTCQYLDCYYNEYQVMQTTLLYWSYLVEACVILMDFCYWPNSFMEEDVGGVFSKVPNLKLFLLKIIIKQKLGCPNKEYNVIFKHFHQSIRACNSEIKKSALINNWENIAYWEESEQSEALADKFGLPQIQLGCVHYG